MKTKSNSGSRIAFRALAGTACAAAVVLIEGTAQAQNLLVSQFNGLVTEFTPNGTQSAFASGLHAPNGLAFDGTGDLFVGQSEDDNGSGGSGTGAILKFTPGGARNIFASGLNNPYRPGL